MVTRDVVVDTSVAFKWFVAYGESALDEAMALLVAHREGSLNLIAPSTIAIELANTFRYALPDAEDAVGLLSDFEATHISLVHTDSRLVRLAVIRAAQTGMGVYDALFLALAEERGCPLVTADRKAFATVTTPIEIRVL